MDLDGFVKLNDARIAAANSEVAAAEALADIALKYAQVGQIREATLKARLENIALALDIRWDAQAHRHLLRSRDIAQSRARQARAQAQHIADMAGRLGRLLVGGTWQSIRDAWIAFNYFRTRLSVAAATKAGHVALEGACYLADAWQHPDSRRIVALARRDADSLWDWAAAYTYYPVSGSAAWTALAGTLAAWSESAAADADALAARSRELAADARALAETDWARLKE